MGDVIRHLHKLPGIPSEVNAGKVLYGHPSVCPTRIQAKKMSHAASGTDSVDIGVGDFPTTHQPELPAGAKSQS